ncbi:MAG: oligosaccharide flippase family protein, partial [Haloarcula sp.]
ILGLRNPGVIYFQKSLEFDKQFIYKVSGDVVQLLVGIGYALIEPTAWAFVFGFIAADLTKLPISYLIHGYRPWLSFDLDIAKELIDYGKWLTGSSVLYFIYSQGDDAFVGWLLTPTSLAYYQYTYRFSNAPATELTQVVNSVMFPAFSKLQEDEERLRSAFLKTLRMTAFIAFPSSIGIAAIAPTFILAAFGEEWMPAVPVMQILAFYGLFRAIGRTISPVLKTIGRPDFITKLSALRVILLAITIYPLTAEFGIVGTAIAVTGIYVFPMMPLDIYIIARAIDLRIPRILYEFIYPALACIPMGLIVWHLEPRVPLGPFLRLGTLILTGVVIFSASVLAIESQSNWQVSDEIQRVFQSLAS